MLQGILIFIVFLGPLIFFHELGHFLFARLFGVRVEVFSIGFGPKLFKWHKGATQYAVSAIPLGGYVKMFGDDPFREQTLSEDEKKVAFNHKSKWARFWIVFGGPLANLILAFLLYFTLITVGEKIPETRLGVVPANSLLYDAGLRSADAIVAINDTPLTSYDELDGQEGSVEKIQVERMGQLIELKTSLPAGQFAQLLIEHASRGLRAPYFVDVSGAIWGIFPKKSTWDPAFSIEQATQLNEGVWLQQVTQFNKETGEPTFGQDSPQFVPASSDESKFWDWMGKHSLFPLELVVESILMQSPADKVGLRQGDILVAVDGTPLRSFEGFREIVQKYTGTSGVELRVLRPGTGELTMHLVPEKRELDKQEVMTIGVYSSVRLVTPRMKETPSAGFIEATALAWKRTVEGVGKTLSGYKRLITKEVSLNNIGGPLAIGKVASDSFHISLSMFFRLMAIISINLGVINLFPIPVLDGGHILFLGFELLNRGPLSRRKLEFAQRFGVSFLFLLIFIALFNDISRLVT